MWIDVISRAREHAERITAPVARLLVKAGVTPNLVTLAGLVVGAAAACSFALGWQWWGALFVLLCGGLDAVDGAVARLSGRATKFGGVLDSTIDRCVDSILILGIVWGGFAEIGWLPGWVWGFLALSGSFLVSYVRARAEAEGVQGLCVGIAERGERLLLISLCGFVGVLGYGLAVVAVLGYATALHRLVVARRLLA